jgi:hypothetical protein
MWSFPGNMPKYYPDLRDILPSPLVILAYYLDKTTYGSWWNEHSLQRTFQRCFLPIYGLFGQTVSEEKNFKNQPIRNKNCLWRLCLLMDRDEMINLYRGPSIDASYQVSVHLGQWFHPDPITNMAAIGDLFLIGWF